MNLLEMNLAGAVLIIAVLILRSIFINRLPKKTFVILWELVLIRLLLPFTLPSIFSVYTLLNRSMSPSLLENPQTVHTIPAIAPTDFATLQALAHPPAARPSVSLWSVIWCVGMVLCACFFVITYLRCRVEFQTALPVENTDITQCLQKQSVKRKLSICQSDRISTPLTYGILRPVILLPKNTDWENVHELHYILSHECVHIKRFDAITKLIAAFALCIHWFNPIVWAMYLYFNRDIELSCDERVIRLFGEKSKSTYSHMLIRMEAKKSGLLPLISTFCKNASEERITAIMTTRRTSPVMVAASCLIVFATASLFATSAAAADDSRQDMPAAAAADDSRQNIPAASSPMSITHESADILYYDDASPYIHDILTNNTDQTITETQYCMLAYDQNGAPLKLRWNFLDSSAQSSFENIVQSSENILPGETEQYRGGWSLYDDGKTADFPKAGDDGANQAAYILVCLKQVTFENHAVWKNPDYENWLDTYAGKETRAAELLGYYPHEYQISLGK
ncbi:MAG: M56 family metallopeptidase [Lachnospiraceae bacterium]